MFILCTNKNRRYSWLICVLEVLVSVILSSVYIYWVWIFFIRQYHEDWFNIFQGAYTGVCSTQHVPSYKDNIDKFKAKGIDSVICVAVNDPYVMNGWAEKLQAKEVVSYSFKSIFYIESTKISKIRLPLKDMEKNCVGIRKY